MKKEDEDFGKGSFGEAKNRQKPRQYNFFEDNFDLSM